MASTGATAIDDVVARAFAALAILGGRIGERSPRVARWRSVAAWAGLSRG